MKRTLTIIATGAWLLFCAIIAAPFFMNANVAKTPIVNQER